jgi:acyl-CoA synthetase (AMP-forming)/AMP-acid ligase II/lauroyl/myristoyl acyltransferase/acyl carrier protein
MDFSPAEVESTIPARFRRVVDAWPGHPAVRASNSELTFAELDAGSDRLAGELLRRRGPDPETIAVLIPPGIDMIRAVFGVLKAGKTCIALSPDDDRRRLNILWENSLRPPILTDADNRPLAASLAQAEDGILVIGEAPSGPAPSAAAFLTPGSSAVLMFTSGTTSVPKGVVMTHRMLLDSAYHYRTQHQYSERDRFSFLSASASSAVIAVSIYTLLCGTTMVYPPAIDGSTIPFLEWMQRERITVVSITALSLFLQYIRAYGRKASLPDLRKVNVSGAELFRADLEKMREVLPASAEYVYRLASTDLNQICELRIPPGSDIPWEKIPVGRAVPGREVFLVNEDRQPVAEGEIGRIAVRSRYLPAGYWRQPALTARRFLPDPDGGDRRILLSEDQGRFLPGGLLEYRGRTDNTARLQGQNIQLEEVDRQLSGIPGIQEAASRIILWADGQKRLAAYIVPKNGAALTVDALRRKLDEFLPPFMIPSLFVFLEALPRLSTDKVDRNALPSPTETRPLLSIPYQAPRNETEKKLCGLWSELLHISPIGVNDSFYDLGGDSLLVLTMSLAVEEAFHRAIPPAFFRKVTIAALADFWRRETEDSPAAAPSEKEEPQSGPSARPVLRHVSRTGGRLGIRRSNPAGSLASFIAMRMPYELGCRWVAQFCRLAPVRRLFLRSRTRLFRQFRADLGGCPDAPEDAELINLAGNILWSSHARAGLGELAEREPLEGMRRSPALFWRTLAEIIDQGPSEHFDKVFHVYDWEYLEKAYAAGQGVILVSFHTTSRMAASGIFQRLRSEPIQTISGARARRMDNLDRKETDQRIPLLDETTLVADLMMQGYQALKNGRIIQIVPDGRDFSVQDPPRLLGGHKVYIQSGFAKLALASDAAVVPVSTTRRLDGSIHSTFFPPLIPRDMEASIESKIFDLVTQYADFLEKSWRLSPESVRWSKMEKHLRRPTSL